MIELPRDLPVIERDVVRLVVVDMHDRVLLFHTHEPTLSGLGQWWELPGGGIDDGENHREAACRELREEAGILITPDQVGPATWRRTASFRHRGARRLQHEVIARVRLELTGPDVDGSARLDYEKEDYFGFRWWPIAEVIASTERFYPGRLPMILPGFLADEQIDEPFELWS
jgi:8-oxo-dGTP pyrophosphatase MutT (NUDIX family)